jgi:hypothetical protein
VAVRQVAAALQVVEMTGVVSLRILWMSSITPGGRVLLKGFQLLGIRNGFNEGDFRLVFRDFVTHALLLEFLLLLVIVFFSFD